MPVATPAKVTVTDGPSLPGEYRAGDLIAAKYRLESILGEGGMGSVWLARNMTLHVDVALKLIRREIASDEAAERLLDEARAAAQINHPSIVRVHDFGETERHDPFIVMELLKGESLRDMIGRKGRLSPTVAVQLLLPILSALCVVHAKGIVHRDIKPDNILLVQNEVGETIPKLVDFGIARLPDRTQQIEMDEGTLREATARDLTSRLTRSGRLLGSPQYMSPEQARGDLEIDHRADLWAVSVVLYEAICGEIPFDDPSYQAVLIHVLTQHPAPIASRGVDEPRLWAILERGLTKDRNHRWPRARELGEALAAWLIDQGVDTDANGRNVFKVWLPNTPNPRAAPAPPERAPAAAPGSPRGRAWLVAFGAVGMLAVGGALAAYALRARGPEGGGARRAGADTIATVAKAAAIVTARPAIEWDGPCPKGMKPVPGGTFQMGSNDRGFPAWKPAHEVTVDGVCVDEKEVTVAQYRACVERGGCLAADARPTFAKSRGASDEAHEKQLTAFAELCNWDKAGRDDHPINCVDWSRAEAYCEHHLARLPTEAEWELAARGSDGRKFPWGNDVGGETYMNTAGAEWRRWLEEHGLPPPMSLMYETDDHWAGTAPVGRFPRAMTQSGQLDMVGNVWEWTADWYADYDPGAQVNPKGPPTGDRKVIRGGGFNSEVATWVNPAARYFQLATASVHAVGFRCAAAPRHEDH